MIFLRTEGSQHLFSDTKGVATKTTPRSLYDWEGPTASWACHCCNRVNDKSLTKCSICGRSVAYVPSVHLPFFGTMAKALRPEQAIFLLDERGFDVNATDSENWTPAHLACAYGNSGLFRVLVERGALLEAQTKGGWTPLHFAAQGGHLECVELLLSKRARVSCVTKGCLSTPLHVAAKAGFDGVCRLLLGETADTEARNLVDQTPLHLASENGHLDVVEALLEAGANPDALDHDKWTPRQMAEFRGFMGVAMVLARDRSERKKGEGMTHGTSTALPAAPWHIEVFSQVRKDAARSRKLLALAAAREKAYSRYANIYKDHAAETYARAVEAPRQQRGGLEAYRRRVIATSLDAERYMGYDSAEASTDYRDGGGAGFVMSDGSLSSSSVSVYSGSGGGMYSSTPSVAGQERGGSTTGSVAMTLIGDEDTSEHSAISARWSEELSAAGGGGTAGLMTDADEEVVLAMMAIGRSSTSNSSNASFVDVVPFHNARAKYLRPWHDTALSRPYHVAPSPEWGARVRTPASLRSTSMRLSTTSSTRTGSYCPTPSVESERTVKADREARIPTTATRRRSKTLTWKAGKSWGLD